MASDGIADDLLRCYYDSLAAVALIVRSGDVAAKRALAANTGCPRELRDGPLASDPSPEVRAAVASNPHSTAEVLERLAGDRADTVRAAVAAHPFAPPRALHRLSGDADPSIRAAAAAHQRCPQLALAGRVADPDREVRLAAGANEMCHPVALRRLAGSWAGDAGLLAAVAANPTTPPDVIAGLLDHADPEVRAAAIGNAYCPERPAVAALDGEQHPDVIRAAAANPSLVAGDQNVPSWMRRQKFADLWDRHMLGGADLRASEKPAGEPAAR